MSQLQANFQVDRGDFQLDVAFTLPDKGVTALFGPSGSGKTSCLRAIAGLERLPNSFFQIGNTVWQDESRGIFIPANQREIGYVFQEASLFPHLNVQQNLEFGLNRLAKNKRKVTPDSVIELLGIGALLTRPPAALSGGERQRVAIARALLTSPELLLMDEPLSALDQKLKQEILPYLEELHRELSIPVIYVSHAPDEVARLADHIIMLDKGELICSGAIKEIMVDTRFATLFADGASTLFEGTVTAQHDDLITEVSANELTLKLTHRPLPLDFPIRCRIYASDVSLCTQKPSHSSILNIFPGRVLRIDKEEASGESLVTVELVKGQKLLAQISRYSLNRLQLKPETSIWAQVKSVAVL
jgi:molybdate transport system ATP-binding protein